MTNTQLLVNIWIPLVKPVVLLVCTQFEDIYPDVAPFDGLSSWLDYTVAQLLV